MQMHLRMGALVIAVAGVSAILLWGCGDDDNVAGPGSGGSAPRVMRFDAGTYEYTAAAWVCGTTDTIRIADRVALCEDAAPGSDDYDLLSLCDTTWIDGWELIADCESEWFPFEGCTVTVYYDLSGAVTGDTWNLAGNVMYQQQPPGCGDFADCMEFAISATRTGPAPDRCQYGDLDTIEMTVTGTPFPADITMSTRGYEREDIVAWDVHAEARVGGGPTDPPDVYFNFGTPVFDRNNLPQVFDVVFDEIPYAGMDVNVGANYSEWSPYPDQNLFSAASATGTLTIEAASDEFFAGSFDIDWTGSTGTPGTRTTVGTFNVENRNYGGGASTTVVGAGTDSSARDLRTLLYELPRHRGHSQ